MRTTRIQIALLLAGCGRSPETGTPTGGGGIPTPSPSESAPPGGGDGDGDGSPDALDCGPDDPAVYPGAPDRCGDDLVTDCDRSSEYGLVTVDGTATFTDLQEALDAATVGSEVRVCPGNWEGVFVAPVAVDLIAHEGADITNLDAGGAGVSLTVPPDTTIRGFTVRNGRSDGLGGGLVLASPGRLTVEDCVVRGNRARTGGGIGIGADSVVTITGSSIEGNTAEAGGGLAAGVGSTVDLDDSVVERNEADHGGGVYLDSAALVGGVVRSNASTGSDPQSAPVGGGGVCGIGDVSLTATEVSDNGASFGGGLAGSAGAMMLTDVSVHHNVASQDGGGAYVVNGDLALAGTSAVHWNRSQSYGGGVTLVGGTLTGGTVEGNSGAMGGGVHVDGLGAPVTLTDVVVHGNTSSFAGGVIAVGSVTLLGGEITGNEALTIVLGLPRGVGDGGALVLGTGTATLDGVLVADNRAHRSGAGLMALGANLIVVESTIVRNRATESGGGVSLAFGGEGSLTSIGTDWGVGADENLPDDVFAQAAVIGYGADASFECTDLAGCVPMP